MSGLPQGVPEPLIPSGVGEGWHGIVAECYEAVLAVDPGVRVDQIKEKFGGLRFYVTATSTEAYDLIRPIIDEAERKSYQTCEVCGEPGAQSRLAWVKTLCDEHAAKWAEGWRPWRDEANA